MQLTVVKSLPEQCRSNPPIDDLIIELDEFENSEARVVRLDYVYGEFGSSHNAYIKIKHLLEEFQYRMRCACLGKEVYIYKM